MAKGEMVISLDPADRARMEAMVAAARVLADARWQVLEWIGHKPGCLITDADPRERVCSCGYEELAARLQQPLPPGAGELGMRIFTDPDQAAQAREGDLLLNVGPEASDADQG